MVRRARATRAVGRAAALVHRSRRAGLAIGRSSSAVPVAVVAAAGVIYVAGLVGLAALLVRTVRRGVERRFDVAVVAYVLALGSGVVAVLLGVSMATTAVSTTAREAHVAANLLGLVGLTMAGTLPFFAGTVVRARMSPMATTRRLLLSSVWQATAVAVCVGGLVAGAREVAAVGLVGFALGLLAVLALLPRPTRRQLQWAGPRVVALWLGVGWWAVAVALAAIDAVGDRPPFSSQVVALLVVPAYGQLVWAALGYLLPMLRGGGHELLGKGFATTRSWPGLVAVNLVGVALVMGAHNVAAVAAAVWLVDAAWRAARIGTRRHPRPEER